MIFTSLALENIGSFYGEHHIELSPTTPDKPIVLIGALNGSGKTTILESLQLGLYGRRAKSLFRIRTGYDEYIRKLFNRQASADDQARIEITFTNEEAGDSVTYRIVRSWTFRSKQPVEKVCVFLADQLDPVLSETWDEAVERLIPRNLSHLFFFDGERIESLADPSQSAEILRTGIYSLLGIELVDQLHADLNIYRRRLGKAKAAPTDAKTISKLESELAAQSSQKLELMDQIASINKDLDAAKRKLSDASRRFEKHGGKIYESRSSLEKERIEIVSAMQQIDDSLRDHCAHALPLCAVEDKLIALLESVRMENRSVDAGKLLSNLENRDRELAEWLGTHSGASNEIVRQIEDYLDTDRRKLHVVASGEPEINMPDEAFNHVSSLVDSGIQSERLKITRLLEQRRQMSSRLDAIDRSMEMMPEDSVIRSYVEEKANAEAHCVVLGKERERLDEQSGQVRFAIEQKERELDRLIFDAQHEQLACDENQRLGDYSSKVQDVLGQLQRRVLIDHLANLEAHISGAFRRLLRKTSLVASVHIDPQTFAVTLSSKQGDEIAPQLISAGERQILAVALLWGLGQAAGCKIPIVIDTPLGRLDSIHRKLLVEEYFPEASHQVILLSTDEEIDAELSAQLTDSIAHRYLLDYDDNAGFTSVKNGYFWH